MTGENVDAMVAALRTTADQLEEAPAGAIRRIPVKLAARVAGVTEAQMRRRCEQNVYGVDVGGYGFKNGGRWEVVIAPFIASLPVSALSRVNSINRAWMRD
ncbi:hypothetical protein [Bradyrhizobium sp. 6(2017)]|uniref:hypothetical protein n=1 Tax=Bradyrhizobium sp. 6(2017) TaxID=1197460 RepID=UPI0013E18F5E|nr:hypothetical protein [Bradyrhizobium sp. 6(2017)]QIG96297.1 hypothetical protein G6P99_30445 [Bradyrhizobium sp. 6(2017)]